METKYQLIILGSSEKYISDVKKCFFRRLKDLGINDDSISILTDKNFKLYSGNAPSCCLYFGNEQKSKHIDLLERLIKDATFIIPIVADLGNINILIPEQLRMINAFELRDENDIEALVSCILESFSLLRISRRIFVSYKRSESSAAAIQIYEQLEKSGFDVFLDTHSIRPGEIFQEELWHRLADSDVVVLLDTPGFLQSEWTRDELAKANSMSIGIMQLIWPTNKKEAEAALSKSLKLETGNFRYCKQHCINSKFKKSTLESIVSQIESLRARSLASRQDTLTTEFISFASNCNLKTSLQYEKWILLKSNSGKEAVIIPTIGVPQAFTYYQYKDLKRKIENENIPIYLLYDHRNIKEKWMEHLSWLDSYLPVKSIKITDVEGWLEAWQKK